MITAHPYRHTQPEPENVSHGFLHWLSHKIHSYHGTIESFERDGHSYIGYQCVICKKIAMESHLFSCSCKMVRG